MVRFHPFQSGNSRGVMVGNHFGVNARNLTDCKPADNAASQQKRGMFHQVDRSCST
jgi:hypothetical protein